MIYTLDKKHIVNNLKLPGSNTIVILNGIHQPELSDAHTNSIFKNQTLKIPENSKNEKPIHLLFLASQNCRISLDIIAEKNSYTTIIEEHASLGDQIYTSSITSKITAENSSEIVHYKLQTESTITSNHQTKTYINQEQNSKITSNFISNGAKTASNILHIKLAGKNAKCNIKGINLLQGTQTISHQIRIEHLEPNCTSNVLFKSIINDQATDNFDCLAIVRPGAIKTETHVTNKNLLLSDTATINTSPELEVYADDIICTHGATVGQLDQEALFYLRSRGIMKSAAIKILTAAFAQEITDQFLEISKYDRLQITAGNLYGQ